MTGTVTISLSDFDELRAQIKELEDNMNQTNESLKLLYQMEIEDLWREARRVRDNRDLSNARQAFAMGKL